MSAPRGQYTLYYSLLNPFTSEEVGHEDKFDDISDALSNAWTVAQKGGKPTHLIYDDAVLFSGDNLRNVLELISNNGAQPSTYPIEIVRNLLPEIMSEQLAETVKFAHEHFGAMVVYRDMLEDLYKAADQAIQKKDLGLLYEITGKMAFWYVPSESDLKQWGKDFLYAYRRDASWLHDAKKALEKIADAVKKLEVEEGSHNAELRAQILKAAEDGLITHS